MIVLLKRPDLSPKYDKLDVEQLHLHHFDLTEKTVQRGELIVFTEDSKVKVLKATKWPYGKPMSAAELIKYIADHAHEMIKKNT
jgi:hypothetical protein